MKKAWELSGNRSVMRLWRVGQTMEEKEIGRRKRTDSARKWREWALIMRFDSASTVHRFRDANGVAMADSEPRNAVLTFQFL